MKKILTYLFFFFIAGALNAQGLINDDGLINDGAKIFIKNNGVVSIKGNYTHRSGSISITNNGVVSIKGNYTHRSGSMSITNNGVVSIKDNYTHRGGLITNNGTITIGGNWFNEDLNGNVFDEKSTGEVQFFKPRVQLADNMHIIGGTNVTKFPGLTFNGQGKIQLNQDADAVLSLNLGTIEVITNNHNLILSNVDPTSLKYQIGGGGIVNTNNGGAFVRATNKNESYVFPLGSVVTGQTLVKLIPANDSKNDYALSMINRDPESDKYYRTRKSPDIFFVNDKYYYQIARRGGNARADIIFPSDKNFNWIVSWEGDMWKKSPYFNSPEPTFNNSLKLNQAELTTDFKQFTLAKADDLNPIEIYNAFSPNGDGKNDTWDIKNIDYYPDNDVKIYDRSGNLVYKYSGYSSTKGWDGHNIPAGSYYYILRVKIGGEDKYYKGSITLIKN